MRRERFFSHLPLAAKISLLAVRAPLLDVTRAGERLVAVERGGHVVDGGYNDNLGTTAIMAVAEALIAAH